MAQNSNLPTGKNTKELIKYFKKNPEVLRDLIEYLNDYDPVWRDSSLEFLRELQFLEKEFGLE